jgi:sorting nexin-13
MDNFKPTSLQWMAPNLSVPLFHLVDVVFQLQDGGWIRQINSHPLLWFFNILHLLFIVSSYRFNSECLIIFYRRQAFWVAKQILQLGMGDTFDDWLVEKIQLLRKGRIVAFAVKRVEQVSGR